MPLRAWNSRFVSLPGAPGLNAIRVSRDEWRPLAQDLLAARFRLLALWATRGAHSEASLHAVFFGESGALLVSMPVAPEERYAGLDDLFPTASRMQRAVADLSGLHSTDEDNRPWLRHASWPAGFRPLVDAQVPEATDPVADNYAFVSVEGDGVHEIPVGPIHAGTIEPGHFRFSVVGEKVLRLEERLGYAHKGIERRFTELPILEGHRLAARVSGDSAVAFSWAYCQALEGMSGVKIPARAAWLRALALELERIANHVGDLGALGNDAGFAFGLAQFSRLKEDVLRATHDALGARYLMGLIVPGGTRLDLSLAGADRLMTCVRALAKEVSGLRAIYDDHEGVRDRFIGAGTVAPPLATRLGLIGLAGRASGQALDLRVDLPCEPYTELAPGKVSRNEGDVAARVAVRFDETLESCALVERILAKLPTGAHITDVQAPAAGSLGIGLVEGWRGPVLIALEAGANGSIRRCHPHDPSWQNWPVLEHAIIGNIVPDFPLINKSFNLSYSGHDL